MRLEGFIKEFYPEWYGIQEYPADKTAAFCKVAEEWGILGNFAPTPIVVGGVPFDCTEKLFQVMKFAGLGVPEDYLCPEGPIHQDDGEASGEGRSGP